MNKRNNIESHGTAQIYNDYEALVSLVVVTYNQRDFVVESLESIKHQSYGRMELIVSDDASSDGTFDVIKAWVESNNNRFEGVFINMNESNQGVSKNITFAASQSRGTYIKCLAGDDVLHPEAIKKMVAFLKTNNYHWMMSRVASFQKDIEESKPVFQPILHYWILSKGVRTQLLFLLCFDYVSAPSVMIKREILEQVEFFGTKYMTREDYHTWIRIMSNGHRIHYLPETLVYYRKHDGSITNSAMSSKNLRWFEERIKTIDEEITPRIPWWALGIKIHVKIDRWRNMRIIERGIKKSKTDRWLSLFDPIFWVQKMFVLLGRLNLVKQDTSLH